MELGLAGKNALITGAGGAFGRQVAVDLAKEGVNVAVADINRERAEETAELCRAAGVKALPLIGNLLDPKDCAGLVDRSDVELGGLNILVNNAGYWPTSTVRDMPLEEWHRAIDINLTAVFLTSQRFAQIFPFDGRRGKILNITSQAAFNGSTTGHAHYAAAKSGVVTFTISMSREVAAKGMNVNAMAIGMMESEMAGDALKNNREYYLKRIPRGEIAKPSDLTPTAVFLVSGAADYLTGATFDVSGGMITR